MVRIKIHSEWYRLQAKFYPDLYNAFLAPGSPCELNIDHTLRFALIKRMTKPDLPEDGLRTAVDETVHLYKEAKASIFKLMASVSWTSSLTGFATTDNHQDSVPKFLRDSRYTDYLLEYGVGEATSTNSPASASPIYADALSSKLAATRLNGQ